MKPAKIAAVFAVLFVVAISRSGQVSTAQSSSVSAQGQSVLNLASTVDIEISGVEKLVLEAAEAMPEKKYNFSPHKLRIRGSDYSDVPTFAAEIKHIATTNYFLWSTLIGGKMPACLGRGSGSVATKADLIAFLKASFALGHKAAATISAQNMMDMVAIGDSKSPRLHVATLAVSAAYDHYGEMVEYLRMNGIVLAPDPHKAN